tara:strand:+ start:123 stop:281 length:159 start_codon:yes stop_codon:yes gene_type:complete
MTIITAKNRKYMAEEDFVFLWLLVETEINLSGFIGYYPFRVTSSSFFNLFSF